MGERGTIMREREQDNWREGTIIRRGNRIMMFRG
jgi:hypothetical protein